MNMELERIYKPIVKELCQVEVEIKNQVLSIGNGQKVIREAVNYFFHNKGKYLRPALVLLSAKSVNGNCNAVGKELILLSSAVEMIHNASLIHDDIIDGEKDRRGVLSLNNKFGSEVAMLIGDMLYTKAFLILVNNIDKRVLEIIVDCVEKMCYGEVKEITNPVYNLKEYLEIISCKTASFMSTCCQVGAILGGGDEKAVKKMKDFGLNFGIAYQLRDDYLDNETPIDKRIVIEKMGEHIKLAGDNLTMIENYEIKSSFNNLLKYLKV